jgi:hypothetical protein
MPRALVRTGALLASLLAVVFVLVPAASAAGAVQKQRHVDIQMRVGAFQVDLYGSEQSGKQSATLFVARHGEFAEYIVPAELTESSIKAKFGTFGELEYTFAPKGPADPKCFGIEGSEAAFTGAFTFTGQNDFIHIDASGASGFYYTYPEPPGCVPNREHRKATASRAASEGLVGDGATLTASTSKKIAKRTHRARALNVIGDGPTNNANLTAVLIEGSRKLATVRGVEMAIPGRDFEWDLDAGTATLRPPAPFSGSATLKSHPGGQVTFSGSLRVPILGEPKPVSMAGGSFTAKLQHGTPSDP